MCDPLLRERDVIGDNDTDVITRVRSGLAPAAIFVLMADEGQEAILQ